MIVAFIGDNEPARDKAAKEFINNFISTYGSDAVVRVQAEDTNPAELGEILASVPFLSPRRMVVAKHLSTNKELVEKIDELVNQVADTTDLVMIEKNIDKRSKYLDILKLKAEIREFIHLEGEDLLLWIVDYTKNQDGRMSYETAQALMDRVGADHKTLANEIDKLVLYNQEISMDAVEKLTSYNPQSSVFAMLDAAFGGQTAKAIKLYNEQRAQGMEPQAILGMIAWQLHVLNIVKAASDISVQEIAQKSKLNPFVVRKNVSLSKKFTKSVVVKMIKDAQDADFTIKTKHVDPDDVLHTLIISFS